MDVLIIYIIIWLVAFAGGIIVGRLTKKKDPIVGTLVIDHESIPEDDPYLFLRPRVNPRVYIGKETVVFDVSVERFVSPE